MAMGSYWDDRPFLQKPQAGSQPVFTRALCLVPVSQHVCPMSIYTPASFIAISVSFDSSVSLFGLCVIPIGGVPVLMMGGSREKGLKFKATGDWPSLKTKWRKTNTSYMAHTCSLTFRRSRQEDSKFKTGLRKWDFLKTQKRISEARKRGVDKPPPF